MARKGLLEHIQIISDFLKDVEMTEKFNNEGGYDRLLEALNSAGTLKAILSFQSVMLNSMKREVEGLYRDIVGETTEEIKEN